jgi:hypothetical protein
MSYNPLTVSDRDAAAVMLFVRRYVTKHSQPDCPAPLSPDSRKEVTAQIVYDWQTADYSEWTPESHQHAAASHARKWRLRNWFGNTADAQAARRFEAKLAKQRQQEGWEATPSTGTSEDSRTPSPLAILIAQEEASGEPIMSEPAWVRFLENCHELHGGLRYVSDRQRKARRKAVRGRNRHQRILVVEGRYETHTAIRWEKVTIHGVVYKGTVANRDIGKSRTVPVPADIAAWAMMGRDARGRFVSNREPVTAPMAGVASDKHRTTVRPMGTPEMAVNVEAHRDAIAAYYAAQENKPLVSGDPRRVRITARWKLRALVNASR